jgi:peptidoglycan/LPS O-acetylase OafA/YrhL
LLNKATRVLVLSVMWLLQPAIGAMPESLDYYLPLGIPMVLYVVPMGMLMSFVWRRWFAARPMVAIGLVPIYIALFALFISMGHTVDVYTPRPLPVLAVAEALTVVAVLVILGSSPILERIPGLAYLGRHSLSIYLIHSQIYRAYLALDARIGMGSGAVRGLAGLLVTVLVAVAGASLLDRWVILRRWIEPRSAADWPPTAGLLGSSALEATR